VDYWVRKGKGSVTRSISRRSWRGRIEVASATDIGFYIFVKRGGIFDQIEKASRWTLFFFLTVRGYVMSVED
jgi:hypothetical protein